MRTLLGKGENMIIGQEKIINTVVSIVLKSKPPFRFLFIAPSGWGKTYIAGAIIKLIKQKHSGKIIKFSTGELFEKYIMEHELRPQEHIILFVDEIHTVQNYEILYPLFENNNISIIVATNTGDLPEPLINRFVEISFEPYTNKELAQMVKIWCKCNPPEKDVEKLIKSSGGVPRQLKSLTVLYTIMGDKIFKDYLQDGLSPQEITYIKALKQLGGKSSLARIKSLTTFSTQYLNRIESSLIQKGVIEITHSGRKLAKL